MADARDVITKAIPCNIVYGRPQAADTIIQALISAGYHITHPTDASSTQGKQAVTEAMVEAGLEYYAEGGCGGLADYERREVVEAIIEAALKAAMEAGHG